MPERRRSRKRRTSGSISSHTQPASAITAMIRASSAPRLTITKPITPVTKLIVGMSQGTRSMASAIRVRAREDSAPTGRAAANFVSDSMGRRVAHLEAKVKSESIVDPDQERWTAQIILTEIVRRPDAGERGVVRRLLVEQVLDLGIERHVGDARPADIQVELLVGIDA